MKNAAVDILKGTKKKKKKLRYYYVNEQGQRVYVSTKKELPYKVRKARSKKPKLSEKERYRRKAEAAKKRSEALKKFYKTKEGEKLKKELSRKAKERAKKRKKEEYPVSKTPVEALTATDRLIEIINDLPDKRYYYYDEYVDVAVYKDYFLREIESEQRKAEKINYETGEIIKEGEQAYEDYLQSVMGRIEQLSYTVIFSTNKSEIESALDGIDYLIHGLSTQNTAMMRELTRLQQFMDLDYEEMYEDDLSEDLAILKKKGW